VRPFSCLANDKHKLTLLMRWEIKAERLMHEISSPYTMHRFKDLCVFRRQGFLFAPQGFCSTPDRGMCMLHSRSTPGPRPHLFAPQPRRAQDVVGDAILRGGPLNPSHSVISNAFTLSVYQIEPRQQSPVSRYISEISTMGTLAHRHELGNYVSSKQNGYWVRQSFRILTRGQ